MSIEFLSPGKKQPTTQLTYFNKEQKKCFLSLCSENFKEKKTMYKG